MYYSSTVVVEYMIVCGEEILWFVTKAGWVVVVVIRAVSENPRGESAQHPATGGGRSQAEEVRAA